MNAFDQSILDAAGLPTIVRYTLTPNANGAFRFNGGRLEYTDGTTTPSWGPVTVKEDTASVKYAYEVLGAAAGTTSSNTAAITISDVAAGAAQGALIYTRDTDTNGWIDGVTVDFRQKVAVTAGTASNLALLSRPNGTTATVYDTTIGKDRTKFGSTVVADNTAGNLYTVKLTTPDVPSLDTAGKFITPTAAPTNDWDGNGTAELADATTWLSNGNRFNTSVSKDGAAFDARPFHVCPLPINAPGHSTPECVVSGTWTHLPQNDGLALWMARARYRP